MTSPRIPRLRRMTVSIRFVRGEHASFLYELGARPTITDVSTQIFASVLALSMDTPAYAKVLDWVQASFTKVVWKNQPTLSYVEVTIRTSRSWVPSNFEVYSLEMCQAPEFIRGRFTVRYGDPLTPGDTIGSHVTPTDGDAAHAARDGVQVQVLWGDDPHAHLGDGDISTVEPPVLPPFRQIFETFATGSDLGWGGSLAPEHPKCGSRAWGSPPPGTLAIGHTTEGGRGSIRRGGV